MTSELTDPFWIGRRLLADGSISSEQFESARLRFKENPRQGFAATLAALGLVSSAKLAHIVADVYGLKVADIGFLTVDRAVARSLPRSRAEKSCALPYRVVEGNLHVAVADPGEYSPAYVRADFKDTQYRDMPVTLFVAPRMEIVSAIDDVWREGISSTDPQAIFEALLKRAVALKASDLHLEPRESSFEARLRVDNRIVHEQFLAFSLKDSITQAAKLFGRMDISERRVPQDGQGKLTIGARVFSFRLSCVPCLGGESIVVRVIDESAGVRSFEDIGLFPDEIERLKRLIDLPNGVIYVTGPTGSGKTTLLYSCLNQLPANDLKIITIEDPVEFAFPKFVQIDVDEKQGRRFDNTLPYLLRQDPDVMLIGETRDLMTARTTIQASLTGHLCFSTLHTNDAVGTITRLTDLGMEPYLIGSAVKGVVGQRLVRRLCPKCKVPVDPGMQTLLEKDNEPLLRSATHICAKPAFFKPSPEGCPHCQKRGYTGRLAICEVYPLDGMDRMIAERRPESELREFLKSKGYRGLRDDGMLKAALGLTSVEEILNVV